MYILWVYIYILCTVPISTPYHFWALIVWAPATSTVDLLRVFPESEVQATYSQPPAPQLTCSRHPELTKHLGANSTQAVETGRECHFFSSDWSTDSRRVWSFHHRIPGFRSSLDSILYIHRIQKKRQVQLRLKKNPLLSAPPPLLMGLAGQATETCKGQSCKFLEWSHGSKKKKGEYHVMKSWLVMINFPGVQY